MLFDAVALIQVTKKRRQMLILAALLLGVLAAGGARSAMGESGIEFHPISGESAVEVICSLSATGKLRAKSGEDNASEVPLQVNAKLEFVDAQADSGDAGKCHVRQYRSAKAEIDVDGEIERNQLSPSRNSIVARRRGAGLTLHSPHGPLTRDDLELLETQFDVAMLSDLLPKQAKRIGQSWKLSSDLVGSLLGLESVGESDVECSLTQATDAQATIRIQGAVSGTALGAESTITLKGDLIVDRRSCLVTSLNVEIKEDRQIGHSAPGFDLAATLKMQIQQCEASEMPSPARMKELAASEGSAALQFASPATGLGLIHDRRWRTVTHAHNLLVLRLVDDGQVLGQCNISPVTTQDGEPGGELARFREQIEASVARYSGRVDETSQATTDDGRSLVRILASGNADGVPITWIYYLVSEKTGQKAALVFILETRNLPRFRTADHELVGGLKFLPENQREALRDDVRLRQ